MTARPAEAGRATRRPARRTPARRAVGRAVACAAVPLLALAAVVAVAVPAGAAWATTVTATSGTLTLASVGARFDLPQASGAPVPQGSTLTASGLLSAGPAMVDVVSTATVPARLTAVLTVGSLLPVVATVQSCTARWTSAGVCPAGETSATLATATIGSLGGSATASWTVDLPAGGRQYAKLSTNAAVDVVPTITLRVSAVGTRAPSDRTVA